MKTLLLTITLIFIGLGAFAQPEGINYQGVARDNAGLPIINQSISLRLSILNGSFTGSALYVETQNVLTSSSGLFNLNIGMGTVISGVFSNVPWGAGEMWLKVEMDLGGGSNYVLIGTTQFMSVPYSLYSKNSGNGMPAGVNNGDMLYWNGNTWVKVPPGSNGYGLALCNGVPTWGGCPITLSTNAVSSVSYTSFNSGGNIINNNGVNVIVSGVCYSTVSNPTINNSKTTDGNGSGSYISSINGLIPNTTYYVRAYATHNFGTAYGNQLSFTTQPLTLPVLTTTLPGNISNTTAQCGGAITSDGGATITAKGVCWSSSPSPTTSNSITNDGNGSGAFTSSITALTSNTTYYVRAYATNSQGTSYGNQISFTTIALALATITTNPIIGISYTGATSGGNVTNDGGTTVTTRGICWRTSPSPTIANSVSSAGSGTGSFTASVNGLTPNTTYYLRSYATNLGGTTYGNEFSFTTLALSLPSVTTSVINNISTNTASGGGNVSTDGGNAVTARGICWSSFPNPTTASNKTIDGTGSGVFNSILGGLILNTTYYVRSYATNNMGTAYGSELNFTTLASQPPQQTVPILGTVLVTINSSSNATSGGYISFDGNSSITSRGVCWSTSPNPTTLNNITNDGTGVGSYSSTISFSFGCNVTYYLRAFAVNSIGTGYGNQVTLLYSGNVPSGITTNTISNISSNTATTGGSVISDGGCNSITTRGVCWSYLNLSPTISDSKTIDGSGTGTFVSSVTSLLSNKTYYLRAYATNSNGTVYGNQQTFTTTGPPSLYLGLSYQGGIIFYMDGTGQHGLIATTSDQGGAEWGCTGTSIPGTNTAIGSGAQNTAAIIAGCGQTGIAARICDNLVLNGYSDWFLPSKDEMNLMYQNRGLIGSFPTNYYWTSSEYASNYAWLQDFTNGTQYSNYKSNYPSVRAVRAF